MTKDQEHPFLRPLWRRVALVAFCAVWAIWEVAYNREAFWGNSCRRHGHLRRLDVPYLLPEAGRSTKKE